MKKLNRVLLLALGIGVLPGCSSLIEEQTSKLANNLSAAILDNNDVATVKDGAPSFLLMIDGLIKNSPESISMLSAGAQLNSAYAGAFVSDEARQKLMLDKAKRYAEQALCLNAENLCDIDKIKPEQLKTYLSDIEQDDAEVLYSYASTWVSWIQANSDDWLAISKLPNIKLIFERLVEYDPTFKDGSVYMYLGGMETLIPPAMGGKPEKGRKLLEKAYHTSQKRNLMPLVLLAEKYARMMFDQALHDQVLQQVIDANANVPGYTLMNIMAQQRATQLLAESADYF